MIKSVTPELLAEVEGFQPDTYSRPYGGEPKNNGLYLLNELVNIDKHLVRRHAGLTSVQPVLGGAGTVGLLAGGWVEPDHTGYPSHLGAGMARGTVSVAPGKLQHQG